MSTFCRLFCTFYVRVVVRLLQGYDTENPRLGHSRQEYAQMDGTSEEHVEESNPLEGLNKLENRLMRGYIKSHDTLLATKQSIVSPNVPPKTLNSKMSPAHLFAAVATVGVGVLISPILHGDQAQRQPVKVSNSRTRKDEEGEDHRDASGISVSEGGAKLQRRGEHNRENCSEKNALDARVRTLQVQPSDVEFLNLSLD